MENYFTPNIKTLYVGYEGYFHNMSMDETGDPELNYDRWDKTILNKYTLETILKYGVRGFKTAFLSINEILGEGWQGTEQYFDVKSFEKDNLFLTYNFQTKILNIIVKDIDLWNKDHVHLKEKTLFLGACTDINMLRQIQKLLF